MDDCVLQNGPHIIYRTVLGLGDDAQRPLVRRPVRQPEGLIEDVGRNMIGMRDKADIHPTLDRLVAVIVPIDRGAHCAVSVQAGEPQRQHKRSGDKPMLPLKCSKCSPDSLSHSPLCLYEFVSLVFLAGRVRSSCCADCTNPFSLN